MPSPYSNPEDLYQLGVEGGYIDPPNTDTSNTSQLPSEAMGRHFGTQELASPTPPVLPGIPGEEGTTRLAGMVGGSGHSEEKYRQLSKTDAELQRNLDSAGAEAKAAGAPMVEAADTAHASEVDAAHKLANAHAEEVSASGRQATLLQKMYDGFSAEEAKINAQATALSNQSKADYMAALVDLRASRVDPQQLWHSQSTGMQLGMLAAAFAHDFLGARGIKTSAMDSLNRAIDKNIDSQVQAIKTKGEVAEGFKSLWYMQRNQSTSDAEARARVRGFLLDSTKQAIIANMAPYESALATAQGQSAVAKIDEEFAKNLIDIYKHIDSNTIALKNQAIERWKTKINAANESWKISIEQDKLNMAKAAVKQAQVGDVLINPETNKGEWIYRPGISEKEKIEARSMIEGKAEFKQDLDQMKTLIRDMKADGTWGVDGVNRTRMAGPKMQQFIALQLRVAHGMVKALGERATDKDVDQMVAGLREPSLLNNGNPEALLAATENSVLDKIKPVLQQRTIDLPAGHPYREITGAQSPAFKNTTTENNNIINPPEKSSEEKYFDENVKRVQGPTGATDESTAAGKKNRDDYFVEAPTESQNAAVKADHDRFVSDFWGLKSGTGGPQGEAFNRKLLEGGVKSGNTSGEPVRNFEAGLHGLKEEAIKAEDPVIRDKALKQLARQAVSYVGTGTDTGNSDDYKGAFALMMLHDVAMELGKNDLDDKETIEKLAQ
jgi:hypothetical protein